MASKTVERLPQGWRVEMLGLINAVQFEHVDGYRKLLWCDGEWTMLSGTHSYPARHMPAASTQAQARTVGTHALNNWGE
jgi:hypothetical protein